MSRPFGARVADTPALSAGAPTLLDAMALVLEPLMAAWDGRVFVDIAAMNPPCAFVHPPVINYRSLADGRFTADFTVLLVSANNGQRRLAYAELSQMLDEFHAVLPGRGVTARPADIFTADGTAILAGYELSWTERLRGQH